jgi:hypothetical protein
MRFLRKAILIFLALLLILAIWIWWNRPRKVNMAAYVPADSLIYLEANDLPDIAAGITSTDAWKALAPPAGLKSNLGNLKWLSRLVSWTGIGPADSVVLSRAQIAVTVLGLDAADAGDTLKIKPRYAVVVETHTGETRARTAVENRIGDFARRAYGEPRVEQKEVDGAKYIIWIAPDNERRIVAAVMGSVAVIGNDEPSVQACLAVRRNERPSLDSSPQLEEMRRRVGGSGALAFGYVSTEGAARLFEMGATVYAAQSSLDPRAQSALASLLPPLAKKILGGAGWSARLADGVVEDRYYLGLQSGVAAKLKSALIAQQNITLTAPEVLPAKTYSISHYNCREPAQAWRGLNAAIISQADTLGSIIITRVLDALLQPYGIEEPNSFLSAIGSEIVTARLDDTGSSTVTIVEVRDEKTLRDFVAKRLGAKPRVEVVGEVEMLISNNEKRDAASFVGGHLIMGTAENVRHCLEALRLKQTLSAEDNFRRTTRLVSAASTANATTFTEDYQPAHSFMRAMANQRGVRERPINEMELESALKGLRYAVSETQIVEGGFEKRTRSSFGQFGSLASQFSTNNDATAARK